MFKLRFVTERLETYFYHSKENNEAERNDMAQDPSLENNKYAQKHSRGDERETISARRMDKNAI